MAAGKIRLLAVGVFFGVLLTGLGAQPGRRDLGGHMPAVVSHLVAKSRLPATNRLSLAISLPLRNEAALDEFIRQLYDPGSTNFHRFITPPEFAARFGPSEKDYLDVIAFAQTNGLAIDETFTNRLVLSVTGVAPDIERAFQVNLRTFRHPSEPRDFFAPDREPSVPAGLRLISVEGLDDLNRPRHAGLRMNAATARPLAFNGSGPNQEYAGNDFRNAYVPGTTLNGAGQVVALLEYSDYFPVDITNYENVVGATIGATNYVPLSKIVVNNTTPSTSDNIEVALDIEMAIAIAPRLSQIIVYEKNTVSTALLNRIATDNLARQVSSSWAVGNWSSSTATAYDNILKNMITQGQSYFQSSGDSDAYTGSQPLDFGVTVPQDSPFATIVGGTTLNMNGGGASYNSETVWNYNLNGIPNEGSGGGISQFYGLPSWQTNFSTVGNSGSSINRNIPDVSLTADNIFISCNNGDFSGSGYAMGTSAAAPLWAGFCALVNQQAVGSGSSAVGFLNPALYTLAATVNYTNYFHDVVTGNNVGTNTAGFFVATNGFDLATGLGTPNGISLINALAPLSKPFLITQPVGQIATNGANVSLSAAALGAAPLTFQWQLSGTNLSAGGNITGVGTNILSLTGATTNNTGNYALVLSNGFGSLTSSVAFLNVGLPPVVFSQPTNLTLLTGSNATFSAVVAASTNNLAFQWKKGGTNLVNSLGSISGATSNVLALTGITFSNAGNYTLAVTNLFGAITSSVAVLTVVLPPAITNSSLTNRSLECGGSITYAVAVSGTTPLLIQWSLDGLAVAGATNTSFPLTNVHQPNHTVAVVVTNLFASFTSNATLTVNDTLGPVITLNGSIFITNELGSGFIDPGATASDACAGIVPVTTNGVVNTAAVSTNTLTYKSTDGNGNTNTATRTVFIRDTTPPTITGSFTNLVVAANSNCVALMTNVTGINFIQATDLSGALTITQIPTNNAVLNLGTNVVVITVADGSGNKSFSTNRVIVQDQTPPVIFTQPQSRTNSPGTTASFNIAATACTPVTLLWFSNNIALATQTNTTLTLSNVTLAAAGNYFAVATASGGSVTSSVASLLIYVPPGIGSVTANLGGSFTLNLLGTPGYTYVLEASTNLGLPAWLPVATNTLGTNGLWQFTDPQATNFIQQFYRLKQTP